MEGMQGKVGHMREGYHTPKEGGYANQYWSPTRPVLVTDINHYYFALRPVLVTRLTSTGYFSAFVGS